jgi:hypothetical protein
MAGEAHKRAMKKWRHARSPHADVLTALERAVAAHPAGSAITRQTEFRVVTRVERESASSSPSTSGSTDAA